jgi:hypothetical protein
LKKAVENKDVKTTIIQLDQFDRKPFKDIADFINNKLGLSVMHSLKSNAAAAKEDLKKALRGDLPSVPPDLAFEAILEFVVKKDPSLAGKTGVELSRILGISNELLYPWKKRRNEGKLDFPSDQYNEAWGEFLQWEIVGKLWYKKS